MSRVAVFGDLQRTQLMIFGKVEDMDARRVRSCSLVWASLSNSGASAAHTSSRTSPSMVTVAGLKACIQNGTARFRHAGPD